MSEPVNEEELLRSVAMQNADSIFIARQRAEEALQRANDALQQKTAELARSLAIMRATLEATPDGILVTNESGNVISFNENFVSMWGIPTELLDDGRLKPRLQYTSGLTRDPVEFSEVVEAIYTSNPTETFHVIHLGDGRVIERFSRVQVLDGEHIGRVWIFRDVTERRRADMARYRLAALVESSDDAIVSKTLDGTVTSWNAAAQRMFGYSAVEMIGRSITTIIPPERLDEEQQILGMIMRGERVGHYETIRRRRDGTVFDVALTVSPIRDADGSIIGASKIARDITDRKIAAREREALLEAERAARAEAERISLLKDEFLANLSHELRTPLNAILGWAQILSMGTPNDEDLRQGIETINRNARLQAKLIEDLLEMSRIISGKTRIDVQQVELDGIVEQAVLTVRPSADAKGIRLRKIIDPNIGPVSGDPSRLQQIVWNLLNNAVKFTPRNGSINVYLQRVNSHIEITVHDTGIGIKPEFLPHVFERFRQADSSSTRAHGGLGLGLAIVKQLVELHGGSVRAESEGEGLGATFVVSLPLSPIRPTEHREHPTTPSPQPIVQSYGLDLSGIRILVLDDESDARLLIKQVLSHCGADVHMAATAADAITLTRNLRPHVIISDIGMPEFDGYHFIRQVRRLAPDEGGTTPAIALTAFARSEDRTRAILAGYQIHIAKPIEPQELVATVASLAGRMKTREP